MIEFYRQKGPIPPNARTLDGKYALLVGEPEPDPTADEISGEDMIGR